MTFYAIKFADTWRFVSYKINILMIGDARCIASSDGSDKVSVKDAGGYSEYGIQ